MSILLQTANEQGKTTSHVSAHSCVIFRCFSEKQVDISTCAFWIKRPNLENSNPSCYDALLLDSLSSKTRFLMGYDLTWCQLSRLMDILLKKGISLNKLSGWNNSFGTTGLENVNSGNDDEPFTTGNDNDYDKNVPVHEETEAVDLTQSSIVATLSKVFLYYAYRYFKDWIDTGKNVVGYSCLQRLSQNFVKQRLPQTVGIRKTSQSHKHVTGKFKCACRPFVFGWMVLIQCLLCFYSLACYDIRGELLDYDCLDYDTNSSTFSMTCSFDWETTSKCIVLYRNERFEGNGYLIYLTGLFDWEGLVRIATSDNGGPSSLEDAPVIENVHMIGGETSFGGGFIIQSEQKHFIVQNCSSSGEIEGGCISSSCFGGGGICGQECSGDILITRCWSSGEIRGFSAGGIAGREFGINGIDNNTVTISHCYSTGDIIGFGSGGICGFGSGQRNGTVTIKQCYSLGEIRGQSSGGITGGATADDNGHVDIRNCYSRGNVTGSNNAGGICGSWTGEDGGTVILTNVYASGQIIQSNAGALIGHIHSNANQISIIMSVYNGDTGDMIGGNDADIKEKNSGNLSDITGTVYCYDGDDYDDNADEGDEECWDTETIWQAVNGDFPIFLEKAVVQVTPSGTPSSPPTSSTSPTSGTTTSSISPSTLPSATKTSTSSQTGTLTSSGTPTPSLTEPVSTETVYPSTEAASPSATPTNMRIREQIELPVQRPPRSVIMKRDRKTT